MHGGAVTGEVRRDERPDEDGRIHGRTLPAEITPAALDAVVLCRGDEVWAAVMDTEMSTYPA